MNKPNSLETNTILKCLEKIQSNHPHIQEIFWASDVVQNVFWSVRTLILKQSFYWKNPYILKLLYKHTIQYPYYFII